MTELSLRFAVTNEADKRAATWKCWTLVPGDSDVYLACRETGKAMKTNMHAFGQWHHAYTENFFEENLPEEDRTYHGWFIRQLARPPEIAPGFTLAFRIVTPVSSITSNINKKTRGKIICRKRTLISHSFQ